MSIRKQPSAECSKCGRTVIMRPAKFAPLPAKYGLSDISTVCVSTVCVSTVCLRPHKCSHGNWCHECQQTHGGWGGWRPGAGSKPGIRMRCGECHTPLTAREWRDHFT